MALLISRPAADAGCWCIIRHHEVDRCRFRCCCFLSLARLRRWFFCSTEHCARPFDGVARRGNSGNSAARPKEAIQPILRAGRSNWYDLLLDFKLISKPEEWHTLRESFETLPSTEYRVLRNGFCFTIVNQSEDFERTLIYANHHQAFVSEVDFQAELDGVRAEPEGEFDRAFRRLSKSDVHVFLKFGGEGCNLGLRVPSSWWDRMKGSCPRPLKEDQDHPCGRVNLVLAVISYREFDLYWEREWNSKFEKTVTEIRSRRDEERRKFGWKTTTHEYDSELAIDWPESIEHKYFDVEHRAI